MNRKYRPQLENLSDRVMLSTTPLSYLAAPATDIGNGQFARLGVGADNAVYMAKFHQQADPSGAAWDLGIQTRPVTVPVQDMATKVFENYDPTKGFNFMVSRFDHDNVAAFEQDGPRLIQSVSNDGGKTFSAPAVIMDVSQPLPNTPAQIQVPGNQPAQPAMLLPVVTSQYEVGGAPAATYIAPPEAIDRVYTGVDGFQHEYVGVAIADFAPDGSVVAGYADSLDGDALVVHALESSR